MSWRCRICGGKVRWRSMVGRKPWNYSSNQFHVVPHSFKVAHISEGAWLAFPSGILHCFAKVIIPDIDSRLIASPLEHQMRCAQVWAVASWFLNGAGNVGCNYRDLWSRRGRIEMIEMEIDGVALVVRCWCRWCDRPTKVPHDQRVFSGCQNHTPNTGIR